MNFLKQMFFPTASKSPVTMESWFRALQELQASDVVTPQLNGRLLWTQDGQLEDVVTLGAGKYNLIGRYSGFVVRQAGNVYHPPMDGVWKAIYPIINGELRTMSAARRVSEPLLINYGREPTRASDGRPAEMEVYLSLTRPISSQRPSRDA